MKTLFLCMLGMCIPLSCMADGAKFEKIDSSTLKGKIMAGYQGWFRTPEDGSGMGWNHYSRLRKTIDPSVLVVDMWPDTADFADEDKVAVPGFSHPDGSQAYVVSSHNPRIIDKHFEWMAQYDIDGAWLQHFLVGFKDGKDSLGYESRRQNMIWVRESAEKFGRVWAICFDTAAVRSDDIPDMVINEWKRVVDEGIIDSDRYLKENGLPVVHVWGLFYKAASNFLEPSATKRLQDFFNENGKYKATLVMGGSWDWREIKEAGWPETYASFKYYTPWNVGNKTRGPDGNVMASTGFWKGDIEKARELGMYFIPVVYPGFTWDNLRGFEAGKSNIPRRRGAFLWEQFYEARKYGLDTFYIAMFDEIDEGTAVFKICPNPPVEGHFVGTEGMPADWYLRLIKEAKRIIKSGEPFPKEIAIAP